MSEVIPLARQMGEATMRLYCDGLSLIKEDDPEKYETIMSKLKASAGHIRIVITMGTEFHAAGALVEGDTATEIFELSACKLDAYGPQLASVSDKEPS